MRFPVPLIMLVLTVPLGLAQSYWTVVDDDGRAADVVQAANFAASMKASTGVEFSGRTMSQARGEVSDVDDLFVVFFRGERATIMADYGEFSDLFGTASRLLEDRGLSVTIVEPDASLFGVEEEEPAPVAEEAVPEEPIPEPVPEPLVQETVEEPVEETVAPPPAREGFFKRVTGWFARLFGRG